MTLVDVQAEARLTAETRDDKLIMTGKLDVQLPVRNRNYSLPWVAIWTQDKEAGMMELANLELTPIQYRLMLLLLAKVSPGNRLYVKQHLIACHFNVAKSTISKAFKVLVEKNVLLQDNEIPGYKLNPRIGWYGSPHDGTKQIKDAPLIQNNYKGRVKPELKLVAG